MYIRYLHTIFKLSGETIYCVQLPIRFY
jgi:hypothetical protein